MIRISCGEDCSWAGIACLNLVFSFFICGPIFLSKISKSVAVILKQLLNPASTLYSKFNGSTSCAVALYLLQLFKLEWTQNLHGNLGRSTAPPPTTTKAAANNRSSTDNIATMTNSSCWIQKLMTSKLTMPFGQASRLCCVAWPLSIVGMRLKKISWRNPNNTALS